MSPPMCLEPRRREHPDLPPKPVRNIDFHGIRKPRVKPTRAAAGVGRAVLGLRAVKQDLSYCDPHRDAAHGATIRAGVAQWPSAISSSVSVTDIAPFRRIFLFAAFRNHRELSRPNVHLWSRSSDRGGCERL